MLGESTAGRGRASHAVERTVLASTGARSPGTFPIPEDPRI